MPDNNAQPPQPTVAPSASAAPVSPPADQLDRYAGNRPDKSRVYRQSIPARAAESALSILPGGSLISGAISNSENARLGEHATADALNKWNKVLPAGQKLTPEEINMISHAHHTNFGQEFKHEMKPGIIAVTVATAFIPGGGLARNIGAAALDMYGSRHAASSSVMMPESMPVGSSTSAMFYIHDHAGTKKLIVAEFSKDKNGNYSVDRSIDNKPVTNIVTGKPAPPTPDVTASPPPDPVTTNVPPVADKPVIPPASAQPTGTTPAAKPAVAAGITAAAPISARPKTLMPHL